MGLWPQPLLHSHQTHVDSLSFRHAVLQRTAVGSRPGSTPRSSVAGTDFYIGTGFVEGEAICPMASIGTDDPATRSGPGITSGLRGVVVRVAVNNESAAYHAVGTRGHGEFADLDMDFGHPFGVGHQGR